MAEYLDQIEALEVQLSGLEDNISSTASVTAQFQQELAGMQTSLSVAQREASGFSRSLSRGLKGAFGDLVLEGAKLSDVLENVAQSMIRSTFNQAISPVTSALSGWVTGGIGSLLTGLIPNANGGAYSQGRVMKFAQGGVVNSPTLFGMRGGTGLMGEAGAEAIMPLSRGADGKLGVRAAGGSHVTVNMNISTNDAESFRRSQTQVAAGINRAIARGNRNQ